MSRADDALLSGQERKTGNRKISLTSPMTLQKRLIDGLLVKGYLLQSGRCPNWRLGKQGQQAQLAQDRVEVFRHAGNLGFELLSRHFQLSQPNRLKLPQQIVHLQGLCPAPLK